MASPGLPFIKYSKKFLKSYTGSGYAMGEEKKSSFGMNIPDYISESLETILKMPIICWRMGIRDF
jgi:hypothetical protein